MLPKVALTEALRRRYEAEMSEAFATLTVYMTNPVGIGEHPQHLEEMDRLLEKHATARDKLQSLIAMFDQRGAEKGSTKGQSTPSGGPTASGPVPDGER